MSEKPSYWESLKVLAAPFATVLAVIGGILIFAGEQWVRGIARDEINIAAGQVAQHETRLTKVEGEVETHDEEIEEVEDDVDEVEKSVREFMRDLINKF